MSSEDIQEEGARAVKVSARAKAYVVGLGALGPHTDEDMLHAFEAGRQAFSHVDELKITWRTLVTYRDLSLGANDFDRAMVYSDILTDIAVMLQAAGEELPDLSEVRR